jgi:Polyketide cyclase / dehydrase and lipid transport
MDQRSRSHSLIVALVMTGPAGLVVSFFTTFLAASYGWSLFVATPFVIGLCAAAVYRAHRGSRGGAAWAGGLMATGVVAVGLVATGADGAICVVMALPLAATAAVFGGLLGQLLGDRGATDPRMHASLMFLVLPLLTLGEAALDREPEVRPITTTVVVDAPPKAVWRHVVAFEPLPPPREAIFRAGIAYPVEATIEGRGVGAVRRCRFSTGDFVEPITAWEEGRLLRFRVTEQPEPMRELSPWGRIHPPHLDGFLRSHQGEFRLTPLPGGRTRVEGTSWYENRMWPAAYWRVWSDNLIHAIHRRVLDAIKARAERDAASRGPSPRAVRRPGPGA